MEEQSARVERDEPMPVFAAYRRGYDPEQVDHYVAEQSIRTEAANARADEAERKLAAAVAQLREMHRRITALEAMEPIGQSDTAIQSVPVDTLGVHVQRILSEAWDGATALRDEAERNAADIKEKALSEGDRIVAAARRKAESIGEEMGRRRQAYLEKLEFERSRAVAQMTFLQEQRELAIADLQRVKSVVDATITQVTAASQKSTRASESTPGQSDATPPANSAAPSPPVMTPRAAPMPPRADPVAATMPVHRLPASQPKDVPDPSDLVRNHRARSDSTGESTGVIRPLQRRESTPPSIFDFDAQESDR